VITLEMPEPPMQDLVLTPKQEDFRSNAARPEAREVLRHRISIGGPVYRRITADSTDDAELQRFLRGEGADSDFYMLHLTCTLRPGEEEPFTEALIELDLTSEGDRGLPIAWSMLPDRLVDAVEISRTVSLTPTLKIAGAGVAVNAERTSAATKQEVLLEAMYELESTPSWGLYRTSSVELRGLYRFHLVVRAPKNSTVAGTTLAEAKVRRRRFGIVPYSARLPQSAQHHQAFTLTGHLA
jgi:hypothetical protein